MLFGAGFADDAPSRQDVTQDSGRRRKALTGSTVHQIKGGVAIIEIPRSFQLSTCRTNVFEDLLSKMKRRRGSFGTKTPTLSGKSESHG